jgi:hypothetical protein
MAEAAVAMVWVSGPAPLIGVMLFIYRPLSMAIFISETLLA